MTLTVTERDKERDPLCERRVMLLALYVDIINLGGVMVPKCELLSGLE